MTSKLNPNYKLTTHTYSSVTCSPWMFCSCTSWSCRRNVRTFRNWMRESSQRLKDGSRNSQSHWQISLWDYCEIGLRQEIWRHISSRVLLGLEDHCKSCEGYSTIFARHSQRNQVIFVCLKQGTPNPHGLENPFPYGHDHGHDLPHFQPGSGGMPCSHVSLRPRSWYLPLGPGREQKFRVWCVWSPVSNSFNNLSWLMLTGCTVSQQSPAWESPWNPTFGTGFLDFWCRITWITHSEFGWLQGHAWFHGCAVQYVCKITRGYFVLGGQTIWRLLILFEDAKVGDASLEGWPAKWINLCARRIKICDVFMVSQNLMSHQNRELDDHPPLLDPKQVLAKMPAGLAQVPKNACSFSQQVQKYRNHVKLAPVKE